MTDREWIFRVVSGFYDKARTDVLIGYHFWIIKDFDEHLPRIAAFWEIQLLGSTQITLKESFDVMKVHLALGIKRGEVGRWMVLFRKTLNEEVSLHPDFQDLGDRWDERIKFFEGVFLRFLGL